MFPTKRWWARLADELDGVYVHSFWGERRHVVVERGRTLVNVGLYQTPSFQLASFAAPFLLPAGPRFRLLSQGTLRMWMRRFGYQDIEIGDAAFDLRYIVKGAPEDQVKTVLRAAARPLTVADNVHTVESNGEWIRVVGGVTTDIDWDEWLDTVSALATADLFGIEALTDLPDAEVRWPEPPGPPIVTVRLPTPVELSCRCHDRRAHTFARARVAAELPEFDGITGEDELPVEVPRGMAARLRCDGSFVELVWPGVCADAAELLDRAGFLAQLVAGRGVAPYR